MSIKEFRRSVGSVILPKGLTMLARSIRFCASEELPRSSVIAFWHGDMIAGWYCHRENSCAMVSASSDGSLLDSVLRGWGIETLRGSSSRGGSDALGVAVKRLNEGSRLLITPDGPRGPRHEMKIGALIASQRAQVPLVFATMKYQRVASLKSWDRFVIPHPFSRVDISYKIFSPPSLGTEGNDLEKILKQIERDVLE